MQTLFKKDEKTGQIRQWSVRAEGNRVIMTHGLKGGAMQEKVIEAKPKNVGRANATTAEEQAAAEAQSRWTKQVEREGYRVWDELDSAPKYLYPMLALDATKVMHRVNFNRAVAQPKLDGVRCIWRPDLQKLQSRKGTFYEAPEHIVEKLRGIDYPLDGELYLHGTPLNLILGASRKYNPLTERLNFHVFDIAGEGTFQDRYKDLCALDGLFLAPETPVKLVRYYEGLTKNNLNSFHNNWVQEGYEGLMIRHIDGLYDFGGRSADLFKYKVFKEAEFKITGFVEDNDGGAVVNLITDEGNPFSARPRGTLEYRRSLLDGAHVGDMATVRYFAMTATASPVPQFPVVVAIGDEK